MHGEEDRLIIEPMRMRGLLAKLAKFPTLEDDIPDVDLGLLPLVSMKNNANSESFCGFS